MVGLPIDGPNKENVLGFRSNISLMQIHTSYNNAQDNWAPCKYKSSLMYVFVIILLLVTSSTNYK